MRFSIENIDGDKTDYLELFLRGLFIDCIVSRECKDEADCIIKVWSNWQGNHLQVKAEGVFGSKNMANEMFFTTEELLLYASSTMDGNHAKALRLVVIQCLRVLLQRPFPWGILTGVRPAKTVNFLELAGVPLTRRGQVLEKMFGLLPEKCDYLIKISDLGRKFKQLDRRNGYLLYISIPFCPSRCSYCSFFTGIGKPKTVATYLESLDEEMRASADLLSPHFQRVDAVYIGGGTPSILSPAQITDLCTKIRQYFPLKPDCEITFEAGRPETITDAMLDACVHGGVTRVCVNPQTMNENTMRAIGRHHCLEDIYKAVNLVKKFPKLILNMDLIVGLPGESYADMSSSIKKVCELSPDNITLHALALKRAAHLRQIGTSHAHVDANKAFDYACHVFSLAGMHPYYLYRQKFTAGDLENVGYANPGFECYYNLSMIEDWQTVLAVGAGANSKFIRSKSDFTRAENPKDPGQYCDRLDELLLKKSAMISECFIPAI